jgi:FKBP-type peptidyl-prolyl cis-trans isomerase FklB
MFTTRTRIIIATLGLATIAHAQDSKKAASPTLNTNTAPAGATTLKDDNAKLSYAIGVNIAQSIDRVQQNAKMNLDQDALSQGIKDVLGKKTLALTQDQLSQILESFKNQMIQKQQAEAADKQKKDQVAAVKNKAEGKKFLTENAKRKGIVQLPSGLQYEVISQGKGAKPTDNDTVEADYKGTLINGKEFDSSAKNGGPASFPVNGVIKGWTEALKLMPVGSEWKLYIPSELAYGDEGAGDSIEPGSALVFDVKLLDIKKTPAAGAGSEQATTPATSTSPKSSKK